MKKFRRILALLLVLSMVPAAVVSAHPFTDVPEGSWFEESVSYVYDNGLMNGTSADTFGPELYMNRAMVVTVLYRMAGSPSPGVSAPFTDADRSAFYGDAMVWAYNWGIVRGTSATTFAPGDDITRGQMVTFLYRYADALGYDTSARADLSGYTDQGEVADYAADAFSWAVASGIISGVTANTLVPNGKANRAQCAAILMRVDKLFKNSTPTPVLKVNDTSATVFLGETYQVDYTYTGDPANLSWSSNNPDVATVDENGVVTAVATGMATIRVTDGTTTKRCRITSVVKTTSIDIEATDGPFYDGVTRYKGDYVWFIADTAPSDATDEIIITSSDPNVISVSTENGYGGIPSWVQITLNFNAAGTATITLTSGDGAVSESYTIHVKEDYDFNPGDVMLTPEEFADYTTRVMCENGFTVVECTSWRLMTLTDSQLTFEKAVSTAYARGHEWWPNGKRHCQIVYVGQDEHGRHQFHTCWG